MSDISVTVSGSFHRHLEAIMEAVRSFNDRKIRVLSPADPRAVDSVGQFIFVASDRHRSIRLVQDRHLASISQSNFLWLVAPDGYVGQSASLELGFAIAFGIPILSEVLPPDLTLRQYIRKVDGIDAAIDIVKEPNKIGEQENDLLLVDPASAITGAHHKLEKIEQYLITQRSKSNGEIIAESLSEDVAELKNLLTVLPRRK